MSCWFTGCEVQLWSLFFSQISVRCDVPTAVFVFGTVLTSSQLSDTFTRAKSQGHHQKIKTSIREWCYSKPFDTDHHHTVSARNIEFAVFSRGQTVKQLEKRDVLQSSDFFSCVESYIHSSLNKHEHHFWMSTTQKKHFLSQNSSAGTSTWTRKIRTFWRVLHLGWVLLMTFSN